MSKIKRYLYSKSLFFYLSVFLYSLLVLSLLYFFYTPTEDLIVDPVTQKIYDNLKYDLKKLEDISCIKYKPKNDFELMKLYPNPFSKGLLPPDCTDAKALGQEKALVQVFSVYLYFRASNYSIPVIFANEYFTLDQQAIIVKILDFAKSGQLSFNSARISAMIDADADSLCITKTFPKRSINKWFTIYFHEFMEITGKKITK